MVIVMSAFAVAVTLMQAQAPPKPANQACETLTAVQVASLIGAAARTMPVTASPTGSTCMFQNNDKVITVLMATLATVDAAHGLYSAKKRIASGVEMKGWGVPAYSGAVQAATVGILLKQTFTEVKVIDPAQKPEAMAVQLQAVMKEIAGRK
jgi:hypothetical protein